MVGHILARKQESSSDKISDKIRNLTVIKEISIHIILVGDDL